MIYKDFRRVKDAAKTALHRQNMLERTLMLFSNLELALKIVHLFFKALDGVCQFVIGAKKVLLLGRLTLVVLDCFHQLLLHFKHVILLLF